MLAQTLAAERIASEWMLKPFAWGVRDCVRLMAAMREAVGAPVELPVARWGSEVAALRALRRAGYADLAEAAAAHLGPELETPLFAQPGDALLFPADGPWGGGLGIALSDGRVLAPGGPPDGEVVFRPLVHVDPTTGRSLCLRGWRLLPEGA